MADSIFNRPLFVGAGQFPEPVKPKPNAPTAPVKFDLSEIYKSDMVPFDRDGITSLMQAYNLTPQSVKINYESLLVNQKQHEEFAASMMH
jgi:hypothetical protein